MENTNISEAIKEQNENTAKFIDQIKENTNTIQQYINEMRADSIKLKVISAESMLDYLERSINHYVKQLPESNFKSAISDTVKSEIEYVKRNIIKDFNSIASIYGK